MATTTTKTPTTHHHRCHHRDRRPNSTTNPIHSDVDDGGFELNESDLWDENDNEIGLDDNHEKPISVAQSRKSRHQRKLIGKSSSPISIPDWSKISRMNECVCKHDDDDDDGEWLPPHEYLARARMASSYVHEGVGRTLKGKDLSRLRNIILKETGFEQD